MIFYDAVLRKNALGCLADRMAIVDADIAPDGVGIEIRELTHWARLRGAHQK